MSSLEPTFDDILDAAYRIDGHVVRTPTIRSRALDDAVGADVWLKCENLQEVGAFKFRGATNAVLSLSDDEAAAGVAAHSSGNHAAALAVAAARRGIPATLVMPEDAPQIKRDAVVRAGGRVILCEPTLPARADTLEAVLAETGAIEIHPYDDPRVIAGAGTATLELIHDAPDLDMIMAPVSGGGLLSGTALAAKGLQSDSAIWGAEPVQVDDAYRSLEAGLRQVGNPGTSIADGLLAVLSDRTFGILRDRVDRIVRVEETEIVDAMRFVFDHVKLVIEPSAAVGVAALLRRRGDLPARIGLILSGGNVDRRLFGLA